MPRSPAQFAQTAPGSPIRAIACLSRLQTTRLITTQPGTASVYSWGGTSLSHLLQNRLGNSWTHSDVVAGTSASGGGQLTTDGETTGQTAAGARAASPSTGVSRGPPPGTRGGRNARCVEVSVHLHTYPLSAAKYLP